MNVALIPARGGSKSILKKNIIDLAGKPLIFYTIDIALKSSLIDKVIVSTDSNEIKEISLSCGAEVPFIRPEEYSNDSANDFVVVKHLIDWFFNKNVKVPDSIIYLRPDFPFRKLAILNNAISKFNKDVNADGLRSVAISKEIPFKTWKVEDKYLCSVIDYKNIKDPHNSPRQLFPKTYWPVGYIEIYSSKNVIEQNTLSGEKMIPFLIKDEYVNIGSIDDLEFAQEFLKTFNFD